MIINEKKIHRTFIDEGASTCIMFVSFWKEFGSPTLNQSPNTLEAFDRHDSQPFGVLLNLTIVLEGKAVHVKVEVVDTNLNYNILLGRSWAHAMHGVACSLFYVLCFPHQVKIIIVNHLSFFASSSSNGNVPYVKNTGTAYESVGAKFFGDPTLMGIFPIPPLHVASVNMILVKSDPWVIPSPDLFDT